MQTIILMDSLQLFMHFGWFGHFCSFVRIKYSINKITSTIYFGILDFYFTINEQWTVTIFSLETNRLNIQHLNFFPQFLCAWNLQVETVGTHRKILEIPIAFGIVFRFYFIFRCISHYISFRSPLNSMKKYKLPYKNDIHMNNTCTCEFHDLLQYNSHIYMHFAMNWRGFEQHYIENGSVELYVYLLTLIRCHTCILNKYTIEMQSL